MTSKRTNWMTGKSTEWLANQPAEWVGSENNWMTSKSIEYLAYQPTQWSKVLYQNLTVSELGKKVHTFRGTEKSLIRRDWQWSLPTARRIQFKPLIPFFFTMHFNLILPSTPATSMCSFLYGFQKMLLPFHTSPVCSTCPFLIWSL
jgi:hypothetical protein